MDFHSLSRRDLQALCKKNRIPANVTNVAMADALQALQTVEGIEEIKEAAQFQSPTSWRTSARRVPVPDEPKGQEGSPLPRARRVAIKASEIMQLVSEGEEEKKEGPEEMPKTPAVRTGWKPQAAPSTRRNQRSSKKEEKEPQEEGPKEIPKTPAALTARNTRRRASKKEETDGHEGALDVAITPATRYGRRASTQKGAEAPIAGEEKQDEAVGFRSTRRTRQSVRKQMEETTLDAVPDVGRRATRTKAAVKMAALAQGGGGEEKKDIATKNSTDQNKHPVEIPDEKSDRVLMEEDVKKNGTIFDLYSRDSEPDDGVQDSGTDGNDNGTMQETKNSTPMGKNLGTGAEGEQISEEEFGQQEDHVLSRLDESPIRGLISSENNQWAIQEQKETLDGTLEENLTGTDGGFEDESRGSNNLDFALPNPSLSNEIPANGEDSGHHMPETKAAGDSPLVQENLAVDLLGGIEATGEQIPVDLIHIKEEEVILDLLPIGRSLEETKVFDNELPVDHALETKTSTDLQGNLEIEDGPAKFPYGIPAVEANDSSDSFEIPEDTEESGNGMKASETEISIDLHSSQIPAAETNDSGDSVDFPEHTEESGASILISKQTAPEPESIHQAASSSRLQQSPSPFPIVQSSDDIRSPAKILALDGDQIGDLVASTVGSPAKTSVQVDDLIGCPQESRTESSAKTMDDLGDPARGFADSGAPVATPLDHGGYETDSNGIVLEVKGGEDESAAVDTGSGGGDGNKENRNGSVPSGLALVYIGGGEAKVKSKAGKPSQPDYNSLSVRKLKAILRERASNLNNKKVEGKRAAFSELNGDDGC
ncbi:uncharacterized protein [Elaeis guineensis]|uniref:Uncharacterized protein LOC105036795 n=1 Tax=Elaeis guineensis var. tenera TaxID=51953 RepID=A0A6I9QK30_ELAGV|nr:uncharacterized protein LOC105036795 [Elaeis guineensis]